MIQVDLQVSFIRPHEAPDLGSGRRLAEKPAYGLPRILSAPSILALERQHCALQQPQPANQCRKPAPVSLNKQQQQQPPPPAESLKRQRDDAEGSQGEDSKGSDRGCGGNASADSHASTATAQTEMGISSRSVSGTMAPGFSLSGCALLFSLLSVYMTSMLNNVPIHERMADIEADFRRQHGIVLTSASETRVLFDVVVQS